METFIGTVMLFAGNFAPRGWAFCQGQLLPIAQNTALFSLLGTTYGGNGQTTFGLPNLQGRVPVGFGTGAGLSKVDLGQMWGTENVTLLTNQIPAHVHAAGAMTANVKNPGFVDVPVNKDGGSGDSTVPTGILSADGAANSFTNEGANGKYAGKSLLVQGTQVEVSGAPTGVAGDNRAHPNVQPSLGMNYIIALEGIYPSRS